MLFEEMDSPVGKNLDWLARHPLQRRRKRPTIAGWPAGADLAPVGYGPERRDIGDHGHHPASQRVDQGVAAALIVATQYEVIRAVIEGFKLRMRQGAQQGDRPRQYGPARYVSPDFGQKVVTPVDQVKARARLVLKYQLETPQHCQGVLEGDQPADPQNNRVTGHTGSGTGGLPIFATETRGSFHHLIDWLAPADQSVFSPRRCQFRRSKKEAVGCLETPPLKVPADPLRRLFGVMLHHDGD